MSFGILLYGLYRCKNKEFKDPLINGKKICRVCDMWSVSHLVFNFILGYMYPNNLYFIIFMGLLWELFEYLIQSDYVNNIPVFQNIIGISKCKDDKILSNKKMHWVYYELTDIPMNIIGAILGVYFKKRVFK